MTREEAFCKLEELLSNPEIAAKAEIIDAQRLEQKKAGIAFYRKNAKNLLGDIKVANGMERTNLENNFDLSVRKIYKLLEEYGQNL